MQTIEALLSFSFFILIFTTMLCSWGNEGSLDTALYRVQLSGDVWRVLQLRGAFDGLDELGCTYSGSCDDVQKIEAMTGFYIYVGGTRFSGPGGEHGKEDFMRVRRVLVVGSTAKNVTFTLKR